MMQKKYLFLLCWLPFLLGALAEEGAEAAAEATDAATDAETPAAEATDAATEKKEGDDDDDMDGDDEAEDTPDDEKDELFDDDAAADTPKSAEDMKAQMSELMKMLNDKNSSVPDETKDQLKGLLDQLKKLGISAEELQKMQGDAASPDNLSAAELNTPTNLMTACGSMASTFYGLKRKEEKLAQFGKIKVATEPKEVLDSAMMHLIVACADDLSSDELRDALKNKYRRMPKRILDQLKSKDADLPSKVKELSMELFEALQQVAEAQLASAAAAKTASSGEKKEKPRRDMPQLPKTEMPGSVAIGALCIFFGTVSVLMWKFIKMQQDLGNENKMMKVKKEKKKNK